MQIARQTPSERNKSPSENSRASLKKTKQNTEGRRSSTLRKNAIGKRQQSAQYAIYRETTPRYTKRSALLSLKRHAAWEYRETTTHHKCLSLSSPSFTMWPNERKQVASVSKNQLFLTRPFCTGKMGKLKRGAL